MYQQENLARCFQRGYDLGQYEQGEKNIQDYYSGLMNLWTEYASFVCTTAPESSIAAFQEIHQTNQHDQFFMKLLLNLKWSAPIW